MRSKVAGGAAIVLLAMVPSLAHGVEHMHPQAMPPPVPQPATTVQEIPVLDQNGNRLNFYSDLVRGRTVAINFIYTACSTFCPMLTANFRKVQEELGARIGKDLALISISIDPVDDTPEKLRAFGAQFEPRPGWTFVTGAEPDIARLLDKLGQPIGEPADHYPLVLVHNDTVGGWTHVDGNDPNAIRDALVDAAGPAAKSDATDAARSYMQNPLLLTQDDKPVHFFDDLLRGKIVLINFMRTNCPDICPMATANLARVQSSTRGQGRPLYQYDFVVGRTATGPSGRAEEVCREFRRQARLVFLDRRAHGD